MNDGVSIVEILKMINKRRNVLIISIIIGIVTSAFLFFYIKPICSSNGTIMINVYVKDMVNSTSQASQLVQTISSYSKKDFIKSKLIYDLQLQTTVEEFDNIYTLESKVDNFYLTISCSSKRPKDNMGIVNLLIDKLKEEEPYFNTLYKGTISNVNIDVVEYAAYSFTDDSNRIIILGLTFIGFIILGIIICILFSTLSNRFDTKEGLIRYLNKKGENSVIELDKSDTYSLYEELKAYDYIYLCGDSVNDMIYSFCTMLLDFGFKRDNNTFSKEDKVIVFENDFTNISLSNNYSKTIVCHFVDYRNINKKSLVKKIFYREIFKHKWLII